MQGYLPSGDFCYYYPLDSENAYQGENHWKKAFFVKKKDEPHFCTMEIEWLEWVRFLWEKEGICQSHRILHKANGLGQMRVAECLVDGFCPTCRWVFQFHGCYYHGHECRLNKMEKKVMKKNNNRRKEETEPNEWRKKFD